MQQKGKHADGENNARAAHTNEKGYIRKGSGQEKEDQQESG